MTKEELRMYKKLTALNEIKKLYDPRTKLSFTYYSGEGSRMEQISYLVERIIKKLKKDLKEL